MELLARELRRGRLKTAWLDAGECGGSNGVFFSVGERREEMPSFVCDVCQDTVKKPKLDQHL